MSLRPRAWGDVCAERTFFALAACALASCTVEQAGLGVASTNDDSTATPDAGDESAPEKADDEEEDPPVDVDEEDEDAGAGPKSHEPDASSAQCELSGLRALKIEAQVSWKGSALLEVVPVTWPGRGVVQITALIDMKPDASGNDAIATVRACGANVPPFISSLSEVYSVYFDDAVWDAIATRWTTKFTRSCAMPGCKLDADYVEPQLGIELPPHAAWPGPRDAVSESAWRDDDGDGEPGIALLARNGADAGTSFGAQHPPVDYLSFDRAREVMLGLRLGMRLSGKMDTCKRYTGQLTGTTLDTRAHGCVTDRAVACRADQTAFLNDNLPVWTVDNATWRMVDLPAGASCAEARKALP